LTFQYPLGYLPWYPVEIRLGEYAVARLVSTDKERKA